MFYRIRTQVKRISWFKILFDIMLTFPASAISSTSLFWLPFNIFIWSIPENSKRGIASIKARDSFHPNIKAMIILATSVTIADITEPTLTPPA